MNNGTRRLEVKVDVLALSAQRAQIVPGLMPNDLVRAILSEFQELDHLGRNPGDYALVKAGGKSELDHTLPLGEQLQHGEQIALVEKHAPVPATAKAASPPLYLREQSTGDVYKLPWLPAIIGRWDETLPQNELVAVNLETHVTGARVSRRQAIIGEDNGRYWIEPMKENALSLISDNGEAKELSVEKHLVAIGDIIHLVRSDIRLKLIAADV